MPGTLSRHWVLTAALYPIFCTAFQPLGQAPSPLEITQIDLFGLKGWKSTQVSVRGVVLGMQRNAVLMAVSSEGLSLEDESGQGCIWQNTCSVLSFGKDTGVSLVFGDLGTVERISVTVYRRFASKEETSAWVSRRFSGNTLRLAEDYSDNSRIRILGNATSYSGKMRRNGMRPVRIRHEYEPAGLSILLEIAPEIWGYEHVSLDNLGKLTFEFFAPKN